MHFEFATATRILFGAGRVREAGALAGAFGRCVLVVMGQDEARAAPLLHLLEAAGLDVLTFTIAGEPTVQRVAEGVAWAREGQCEVVIGFGGGSALDAGKAIAALLTNPGEPLEFLEVIGRGQPLTQPAAPVIAIPTTAGTGSEVTSNAVLASPEHRVKVSLRSPGMLPRVALVDPELTHSLPPALTASTGLDALTQLIEPFVSPHATPLSDALCREGIPRVARALPRAYAHGADAEARTEMALGSLLGGMALANAKLGAVHGFAGPLGGMVPAPHGAICAALLPHAMAANVAALHARAPQSVALQRYAEVARLVTGRDDAQAEDGVAWVQTLCQRLNIPPLATWGLTREAFPALIENAARASSMKGNPVALTAAEMETILAQAL